MMEQKILKHLERLIAYNSTSADQVAVYGVLEYVNEILKETGKFKDSKIHKNDGVYSLTASTQGTKKPRVLLQCHVDVVPSPESLRFLIKGDKVYGRGVYDMLFAAAAYINFIETNIDILHTLDLGLMLTGDEELGGLRGVNALLKQDYGAAVCILPDAGQGFGDLNISAKGVYDFDLVAHGKAHHGSRPWEGDGAANKLVLMLAELMQAFDTTDKYNSTMTVSRLSGGDADNKGPGSAKAHLDIRFKDKTELARIEQATKQICDFYGGSVENVIISDDYNLDVQNSYIQGFLAMYEQHAGSEITMERAHGSSDAPFFAARGVPVVMFRPDGDNAHGDDESLSIKSLGKFYALLSEFILKTTKL